LTSETKHFTNLNLLLVARVFLTSKMATAKAPAQRSLNAAKPCRGHIENISLSAALTVYCLARAKRQSGSREKRFLYGANSVII